MIFEVILNLVQQVLFTLLSFINLPQFPEEFTTAVDGFFQMLFDNVGLLSLALPWSIVTVGVPLLVIVLNLDKLYTALMWILRKIPMLGIQ